MQPEHHDTPAPDPAPALPVAVPVRRRRPRPDPAALAREAARTRRFVRAVLLALAAALTGVFVAAYRVHPYDEDGTPRTMSTHTQLGMPPCNFVALTGKPCPSCGMTTSFALLVRGDVLASARANWVGSVICVLWMLTLLWAVAGVVRGRLLWVRPGRGEVTFTIIAGAVLVLMLGRWGVILIQG